MNEPQPFKDEPRPFEDAYWYDIDKDLTVKAWQADVAEGRTRLGYRRWVAGHYDGDTSVAEWEGFQWMQKRGLL